MAAYNTDLSKDPQLAEAYRPGCHDIDLGGVVTIHRADPELSAIAYILAGNKDQWLKRKDFFERDYVSLVGQGSDNEIVDRLKVRFGIGAGKLIELSGGIVESSGQRANKKYLLPGAVEVTLVPNDVAGWTSATVHMPEKVQEPPQQEAPDVGLRLRVRNFVIRGEGGLDELAESIRNGEGAEGIARSGLREALWEDGYSHSPSALERFQAVAAILKG